MKKIYLLFSLLCLIIFQSRAQISIQKPTGNGIGTAPWSINYTSTGSWSNNTSNIENMADGDLSTAGTIGITKGIGGSGNDATVTVDFTIPSGNNGTIIIETDEGSKLLTSPALFNNNNAIVLLWNGSSQYTASDISIEERTKADGSTFWAIHAPSYGTISKMSIKVSGTGGFFSETDGITIKDIYWYNGVASNTDCGSPVSTRVSYTVAGLPLSFASYTNWENAIDGNESTWSSDGVGVGIGGIGFFYYNHNIYFNGLSNANNSSIRAVIGVGINIGINLSASMYKVDFVKNGTIVDGTDWRTFSTLNILGIQNYNRIVVEASSSQPFDEAIIRLGYAGANVTLLTGTYFRLYEIKRTANAPTVSGTNVQITYGTPATVTASGIGNVFVWRKSTTGTYDLYDGDGNKIGTATDTIPIPGLDGIITSSNAISTNSSGISTGSLTTGNLFNDSTLFVSTVMETCGSDTSKSGRVDIVLTSTIPALSVTVNPQRTATVLNWSIANEYKVKNLKIQRRLNGSNDSWNDIATLNSSAPADPNVAGRYSNTGTIPTNYTYTDPSIDPDKLYEYRILVIDNSSSGVESNIAAQPYVLPVKYAQELRVYTDDHGTNVLGWITAQETNNKGFHILRGIDGKSWSEIAFVRSNAYNGNGNGSAYKYNDAFPFGEINYYLLEQEDLDGKKSTSNVVFVNNKQKVSVKVYPNPFADWINIGGAPVNSQFKIIDMMGKCLLSGIVSNNPVTIVTKSLPTGIYILELFNKEGLPIGNYKTLKR